MKNETALRWAINLAALIVLMDLSVVSIALPAMRAHFESSVSLISLVLMVSMLSASSSALITGKISQLFCPQKILIFGFLVFGISTFLSGFVSNFKLLLLLRFIQGFAEASLYIIGPATIKRYLPLEKQAQAYGQWMMSSGIGMSIGPLIGGYLVGQFSWQSVFFVNIPFILLGLFFSLKLNLKKPAIFKERFDFQGAVWSFVFLASLIAGLNLSKAPDKQWIVVLFFLLLSGFSLLIFIRKEKTTAAPILQLSIFRSRNFWLASWGFFLFFTINVGARFLSPFFFEEARGFSSELSGLLMVVAPVVMVALSPFTHYFQKIWGTKKVVLLGNAFLFLSMILFGFWSQNTDVSFFLISMLILGIGMGFFYPAATTIGMQALTSSNYGMGSAAISTAKSLGKLFGVLVFAFLFTTFLQELTSSKEDFLILEKTQAIRNTFRVGAALALLAFLFSFFFDKTENSN